MNLEALEESQRIIEDIRTNLKAGKYNAEQRARLNRELDRIIQEFGPDTK